MDENKVVCPICGKEHSTVNQNGILREVIYCQCRREYGHTLIEWVAGCGFYCMDNGMKMIPC